MTINFFNRLLFSPLNVQLIVTRRCNLACKYCNEYDKISPPVEKDQLKKRIDKLNNLGAFSLTMSGGEPLLHPDIYQLIHYSKKKIFKVGLITNGFLLTKDKITKLNDSNLDSMQISIDSLLPNKNSLKTLQNLKKKLILLKKYATFEVNTNSVIGSTNSEEALEVIKVSNNLGFKATIGLLHDIYGQVNLNKTDKENFLKANKIRNKPFWDIYNFELKFINNNESPFKCRAGSRYLYLDEYGFINWCSQKRGICKKIFSEYTFNDLKTQFYKYKKCSRKCTIGCVRKASILDSWRRQNS